MRSDKSPIPPVCIPDEKSVTRGLPFFAPNPIRNPEAAKVVKNYQAWASTISEVKGAEAKEMAKSFGDISINDKYLFTETDIAKQANIIFLQEFFKVKVNKQLSDAVLVAKKAYVKLSCSLEGKPFDDSKPLAHKCIGFTTFARDRGKDKEDFCVVSLSGTLTMKTKKELHAEFSAEYKDASPLQINQMVNTAFEYFQLEMQLSNALSAAADKLNKTSPIKFIYHDNPSENFRNLMALRRLTKTIAEDATDIRRPCAELSAIKVLGELWRTPKYKGTLSVTGGVYLLLPQLGKWKEKSKTIKLKNKDKKNGKFILGTADEQVKLSRIPCCKHCKQRKNEIYLPFLKAAAKEPSVPEEVFTTPTATPVKRRPPLSGDAHGRPFLLTPYTGGTSRLFQEVKACTARKCLFGGTEVASAAAITVK